MTVTKDNKCNVCLRQDGLYHQEHSIVAINDDTFKCYWCKKYFKEVDVNGIVIVGRK